MKLTEQQSARVGKLETALAALTYDSSIECKPTDDGAKIACC